MTAAAAALIMLLTVLLGGSSYEAIHEHTQLKQANDAAKQTQVQLLKIQADFLTLANSMQEQMAAIKQEDADLKVERDSWQKESAAQMTFVLAVGNELAKPTPDITSAVKFNKEAVTAGETPSAATQAAAKQLSDASDSAQAALITQLRKDAQDAKDDRDKAVQNYTAEHALVLTTMDKEATAVADGKVATEQAKNSNAQVVAVTADNTSLLTKLALKAAEIGRYVAVIVAVVLLAIGLFYLWRVEKIHHAYTKAAHLETQTKLAAAMTTNTALTAEHTALQKAHTDLLSTIKNINPPTT